MKILVVEDEPASLKLAHLVLSSDGHEVAQAEAVDKALEEIARTEPEVVLLDLELPNVGGLALARHLKADPARKHIVIVAVTAYPERFSREEALAAGCDAFIVKPINTRKLTSQVAHVVERLR
jgi:two-component system cell cycle response regulator